MSTCTWHVNDGFDLGKMGIVTSNVECEHANWVKLRENGWVKRRIDNSNYYLKSYKFINTIDDPCKLGITYFNTMDQVNEYIKMKLNVANRLDSPCTNISGSKEVIMKKRKNDTQTKLFEDVNPLKKSLCVSSSSFSILPKSGMSHCPTEPSLPFKVSFRLLSVFLLF